MSLKLKIKEIRKIIKKSKKPVMFFDVDADGTTSYLQLKNRFKKITGYPLTKDLEKQKKLVQYLDEDTDLILIFDIPYLEESFLKSLKGKSIIWVDHHLTNSKQLIKKYNINHLNPIDYDEDDNRPVTYLTYLIANRKKNLPYVAIGSISDFFLLDIIPKFYKKYKKEFNLTINLDKQKRKELFKFIKKYKFNDKDTTNHRSNWIKYLTYDANVIEMKNFFDLLFKLEDDNEILETIRILEKLSFKQIIKEFKNQDSDLFKNYSKIDEKYKTILNKAIKKEQRKRLFFFEYSGKISFTRQISEYLSYKHSQTQVIGVCFKKTDASIYTCSFRGNNYNVNELVIRSLKNLNGRGGGHPFAAGMSVSKRDFEKFKKKLGKITNSTIE